MSPRRSQRKNPRRRRSSRKGELPSNALIYRGPVSPVINASGSHMSTIEVHGNLALTSSAGGVLSGVISLRNPSQTSGWTNLVGVYDEFRVLASSFKFVPQNTYNSTIAQATPPILTFIDRDTSIVPTTTTIAQSYESCKVHSLSTSWSRTYRMMSADEAIFVNSSAPTGVKTGSFAFITINTTANSITYGYIFFSYLVQFRAVIG